MHPIKLFVVMAQHLWVACSFNSCMPSCPRAYPRGFSSECLEKQVELDVRLVLLGYTP